MKHSITVSGRFDKAADEGSRMITWVGSTESVDRDGDSIPVSAWRLDNYKKNPVILWGHSYVQLPIAKAADVRKDTEAKALVFDIQFPTQEQAGEHYAFSDSIYRLASSGYLTASSVGFKAHARPEYKEVGQGDHIYVWPDVELLELSIVPVPANQEALRRGFESGEVKQADIPFVEKMLQQITKDQSNIFFASQVDDVLEEQRQKIDQQQPDYNKLMDCMNRLTVALNNTPKPFNPAELMKHRPWAADTTAAKQEGLNLSGLVEQAISIERKLKKEGKA